MLLFFFSPSPLNKHSNDFARFKPSRTLRRLSAVVTETHPTAKSKTFSATTRRSLNGLKSGGTINLISALDPQKRINEECKNGELLYPALIVSQIESVF